MTNILYVIAVVMIIFWAIGFFAYSVGSIIHVLLVLAVIAIVYNLVTGNRAV